MVGELATASSVSINLPPCAVRSLWNGRRTDGSSSKSLPLQKQRHWIGFFAQPVQAHSDQHALVVSHHQPLGRNSVDHSIIAARFE